MTSGTEARTIAFCQELVRLESLSGQEQAVAEAVEREMRALGYDEVRRDELGSVIGVVRGARAAGTDAAPGALLFDAHLDVVPATEPEAWRLRRSRASARRAASGAGAPPTSRARSRRWSWRSARCRAPSSRGRCVVSASVGEERIEGLAVGHVLAAHPVRAAVICEPTGLRLGLGHRGRASLVVEAAGRAAHTSRAENGINAVYRLTEAIARVRAAGAAHRRAARPRPHRAGRGLLAPLPRLRDGALPGDRALRPPAGARRDARERAGRDGAGARGTRGPERAPPPGRAALLHRALVHGRGLPSRLGRRAGLRPRAAGTGGARRAPASPAASSTRPTPRTPRRPPAAWGSPRWSTARATSPPRTPWTRASAWTSCSPPSAATRRWRGG